MTRSIGEALVTGGAMPGPIEGGFVPHEDQERVVQSGVVTSPEGVAVVNTVEVDAIPVIDTRAPEQKVVDQTPTKPKRAPSPRFDPFRGYKATEPEMFASRAEAARASTPAAYVLGAYSTAWTDM